MTPRKTELLDAAITFVADHGVAKLSLRPLAAHIGTSARLLIFHFGSKERLLAEILAEVQRRLQAVVAGMALARDGGAIPPLRRFWDHVTRPENLPMLRVIYEAHFIALQNPAEFGSLLADTSNQWIDLIEARLPDAVRSKATATLCAAVVDGLLIELIGSGNRRRTTQALDLFIALLAARARS